MTATELLTLGLDLYGHLRLPALLVLSEIGIEIMHQRKNMKKVNMQVVSEKIQNTATSLKVIKNHLNTEPVVADWLQRFFCHEAANNDLARFFDNIRSPSPFGPNPPLTLPSSAPPSSSSASSPASPRSPLRRSVSPTLSTPPFPHPSGSSSMQKKSTFYQSC